MSIAQPTSSGQYDAEQVARFFDAYGIREWNRLVQNPAQEVSLHLHTHYLEQYVRPGQRALEIGAGAGRFTQILARLGVRIIVGDLSQVQLDLNRQHAVQYDFASAIESWEQVDICDMARFTSETFDCVVAYGSPLGYVLDQRDMALAECLRVLKPNGLLILSVASLWGSAHRHLDGVLSIPASINQQITTTGDILPGMIANREQFFHMFRASELRQWLEEADVKILAMSASDCLATGWGEMLKTIRNDAEKWEELLRMEVEACAERESWNMGMHTIAVARKTEDQL
jgi:2-polyprenyl-3-methyl-5-hydroxy-6-metoxy-1,4-benzoquinol methylase